MDAASHLPNAPGRPTITRIMLPPPLRVFVPPTACRDGQFALEGEDAERLRRRWAGPGQALVAVDGSGWEVVVDVTKVGEGFFRGKVAARRLVAERRTQISLYHGLLHPADYRRLLQHSTALGVIAFTPLITDSAAVPMLMAYEEGAARGDWDLCVRDAAEEHGRGRMPEVRSPLLFDHALDEGLRAGPALLVSRDGEPPAAVLTTRPFVLSLFAPPADGFSEDELRRAAARPVPRVAPAEGGPDPSRPALSALGAIYTVLEG